MSEWKVGMPARLKTGGPAMTVKKVWQPGDGTTRVLCEWFHDDYVPQQPMEREFDADELVVPGDTP